MDSVPHVEARPPLDFGIFDWIDRNPGVELDELYEGRLRMLEYADAAGIWCYHLAEHHFTPLGSAPSPALFLAAAAQRTRRIRLGPMVYCLPLYNPVRQVEEICMLDHLSHGRLELGVGRGISQGESAAFHVDITQSREMFFEALAIIRRALATGHVGYAGAFYQFTDAELLVRPRQQPYPPLWYPTSNPDSIPWVASQGINTVYNDTGSGDWLARTAEIFATYRRLLEAHRADPDRINAHVATPRYGFRCHVYVGEDDAQAEQEATAAFDAFVLNHTRGLGRPGGTGPLRPDLDRPLERGTLL